MIIPLELQMSYIDYFKKCDIGRIESAKYQNTNLKQIFFFDKDNQMILDIVNTSGFFEVVSVVFELYKERHLKPTPSIIEVDEF